MLTAAPTPTVLPEAARAVPPSTFRPATAAIVPVGDRAALREFVELPFRLYAGDARWVPPLRREELRFFSTDNPYIRDNPTRLFLARRGGETVGRIAATVSRTNNAYHQEKAGFFGFFECDGEPGTVSALVAAAARFLAGQGMERMRGPFNLTTNHTCGLLVDGFGGPPVVDMPYNPPAYGALLEEEGFAKAKDLVAHWIDLTEPTEAEARLAEIAAGAPSCYRVREMHVSGRGLARDMEIFYDLYHHAWRNNWGFVPLDREEYAFLLERMRPVLTRGLSFVAEADGEPAGVFIGIPDFNQVLPLLGGRLTPLGALRAWRGQRRIDAARYLLTGIYDRFRGTPVAAMLLERSLAGARAHGYRGIEVSWVLEDNEPANRFFRKHGLSEYRRYRIYERPLAGE